LIRQLDGSYSVDGRKMTGISKVLRVTFWAVAIPISGRRRVAANPDKKGRTMKKRLLSVMAMCILAGSLNVFAQDNMKPENKDQTQSGDSMKHDNMSNDSMKHDNMANENMKHDNMAKDNMKKSSNKKKSKMKTDNMSKDNMKNDQQDQMKH
jgi:pentapeptide MXKDX repeat protein